MKILTIDDDEALCMALEIAITENGDEAFSLYSLDDVGVKVGKIMPDIILLDIEFNDGDGVQALPKIKAAAPFAIILFMSSHTDSAEVTRALGAGGITYLKKPVSSIEVLAQINALRRNLVFNEQIENIGSFLFDAKGQKLLHNGTEFKLTLYQAQLLKLLVAHQEQVISRQEIYLNIWHDELGNDLSLNNMISQLRKILKADPGISLHTIGGVGYKLCVDKP